MGNSCNINDSHSQTSSNPSNIDTKIDQTCLGCIGHNHSNAIYVEGPEIHATHFGIPKGRISSFSIAYLKEDEITFFKLCAGKNLTAIRYFLRKGVSVNILDEDRTSPLHVACKSGSFQVVEELINWGANINIADMAGWTPLHIAAYYQKSFICHLLLKKKADPYCVNRIGETPWDLVRDKEVENVFNIHFDRLEIRNMTKKKDIEKNNLISNENDDNEYDDNDNDNDDNIEIRKHELENPRRIKQYKSLEGVELIGTTKISNHINKMEKSKVISPDQTNRKNKNSSIINNNDHNTTRISRLKYKSKRNHMHKPNYHTKKNAYNNNNTKNISSKNSGSGQIIPKSTRNNNTFSQVKQSKSSKSIILTESNSFNKSIKADVKRKLKTDGPDYYDSMDEGYLKCFNDKENMKPLLSPKKHKYYLCYKKLKNLPDKQNVQDMLYTLNSEDDNEGEEYDIDAIDKDYEKDTYKNYIDKNNSQKSNKQMIGRINNGISGTSSATGKNNLEEINSILQDYSDITKMDNSSPNIITKSLIPNSRKSTKYIIQSHDLVSNNHKISDPLRHSMQTALYPYSLSVNTSNIGLLNSQPHDKIRNMSPKSTKSILFVNCKPISIYKIIQKENMIEQYNQSGQQQHPNSGQINDNPFNQISDINEKDMNIYDIQFNIDPKYNDGLYQMGIDLFNYDGLKGLSFLILLRLIRARPYDIANFLFHDNNNINSNKLTLKRSRYEVTQILTNINILEVHEILSHYADCYQFHNMSYIMALRYFLSNLILDNDPEKIDLLVYSFAKKYYQSINHIDNHNYTSLIFNLDNNHNQVNNLPYTANDANNKLDINNYGINLSSRNIKYTPTKLNSHDLNNNNIKNTLESRININNNTNINKTQMINNNLININKETFENIETIHMLSFATVMLDINLHHNNNGNNINKLNDNNIKELKDEFHMNLIGINDGENLSKSFIDSVFDSIYKFKLLKLYDYNYDINLKKSIKKLIFKNIKFSIKLTKQSKKNRSSFKEYNLNVIGPIALILKNIDLRTEPKCIINLAENRLKLYKQAMIIIPNNPKKGTITVAKFTDIGIISLCYKSKYEFNMTNVTDFAKIENYIKSIKSSTIL